MPLNSLTPYKSPRPDRLTVVDLSFDEWVSRPKPTPNRVKDHLRDAFHAGYHRGKDVGESDAHKAVDMGG